MAMGWLKGLVAPGFPENTAPAPGGQAMGGPPMGGAPSPYGVQPGTGQPGMMPQAPGMGYDASGLNSPMQWSTGTKTLGETQGKPSSAVSSAVATAPGGLEARCAQLQHDVDSLALFSRTLLTLLEEAKVVTREQFEATHRRLDMLDGKLDDR